MSEFAIFGLSDLSVILDSVVTGINEAYASGCPTLRIYLDSFFAYRCLVCWTPGWIRKSGPSGIWKNSRGK